jgi:hypothetical protein
MPDRGLNMSTSGRSDPLLPGSPRSKLSFGDLGVAAKNAELDAF